MLTPVYLIRDRMVGQIPSTINELGLRVTLANIHPETNTFTLGVNTTQKDYIVFNVMEKPGINILWIGTIIMTIGFGMAVYRRYLDVRDGQEGDRPPKGGGRQKAKPNKKSLAA